MLQNIGRALGFVGGACGWIATAAIFIMPLYEGVNVTVTLSGERIEQHFRKTLLEMQSLEAITIFFFTGIVFFSLAAIFCAARTQSPGNSIAMTAIGVLLLLASFISGFSVGAFYLPGAIMVFAAGILTASR